MHIGHNNRGVKYEIRELEEAIEEQEFLIIVNNLKCSKDCVKLLKQQT
jgi:hypothetical protein